MPCYHSIDNDQKLFVYKIGEGYTCLGFDVLKKRGLALAAWLNVPINASCREALDQVHTNPNAAHAAYNYLMECANQYCIKHKTRCPIELTPELIGMEGKRVEVLLPNGEKRRFYVGKSTGWMPCHLEIKTKRSTGGTAVYFPKGSTVRVIR